MESVTGQTIGSAYRRALEAYLHHDAEQLVVTCNNPIRTLTVPDSYDIDDWDLNLGREYDQYQDVDHYRKSTKTGGSTGRDWINDRIIELHDGVYADRMAETNQLDRIIERLSVGMHGSCTNALVAQVFRDQDFDLATEKKPSNKGMACVTQLQFRPSQNELDLHMTLRSQYVDLKGFGNLAAAATLLAKVCAETGYEPGNLVEHVNNATEYASAISKEVYDALTYSECC